MSSPPSDHQMKAVMLAKPGGPEQMSVGQTALPRPCGRQLLIRVRATAVNRADTLQREGRYPAPPGASDIIGLECAGEVVARGDQCTRADIEVGSRVMALLGGGGYAQFALVDEGSCMTIPANLSFSSAAAIPEVFLTAYLISRQLGELKRADLVLIHAGASGVGTALIQLCTLFGATSIVSVSSTSKADACKSLGASFAVNYKTDDRWNESVKAYAKTLGKDGVDLVLDCVGASHALHNLDALTTDGRWILYGLMGGFAVENFPLIDILKKRVRLQGSTLRMRSDAFKADLVGRFSSECMDAIKDGRLKPIIEKIFPSLSQMGEAHSLMESNTTVGKIVVQVEHDEEKRAHDVLQPQKV